VSSHLPPNLPFSLPDFEANQSEILLRMGDFFLNYLHRLRKAFDGDFMMAIVLGEIGHHNASSFFSSGEGIRTGIDPDEFRELMECCNAHSLSAATGIPRETIRRKIDALLERGWIEKVERKGLRITPACIDHFAHTFNLPVLAELLLVSRAITKVLPMAGGPSVPPQRTSERRPASNG